MKHIRKLLALGLVLCLCLGLVPTAGAAQVQTTGVLSLTGNTGAEITFSGAPLSAEIDDNDLAIVELRGSTVRVLAKEGALGVARLTVETAAGYEVYDVPVGYTTFVFEGDSLTVIPGSDSGYTVTGVNQANESYAVGDIDLPLPEETDMKGWKHYENTEAYKLLVSIPKTGGTYVFTGTGADGAIAVKKAATAPAVLLLAGLNLTSSFTAPITVKKESTSTVTVTALAGWTNTLADAALNNADLYGDPETDGGDGTNVEFAESAVIKAKSYANLTLNGEGTLSLICATKNGLKVGEYGALTIDGLTLNVTSAKNGISSDNTMVINGGAITVTTADGDCIRSDPDAVNAEAGCAGNITINGGLFTLQAASDGIQAAQDLTITGGEFHITTGSGWNDSSFNKDTMSCKGLKASFSADEETTDTEATNRIAISGGSFDLNTADDAIHSDADVTITGGVFAIQTGDDGVHGDGQVDFGAENGPDCGIQLTVSKSYEALEGANVYFWSGVYHVTASDDGVNAAGGSSNGTDPGGGGWDPWNPGGPGGGGGSTGNYHLYVKGGLLTVNAEGDGLDSNGNLELTGGTVIVWGAASNGSGSDNAPLDCDGTLTVKGATVFAGGSRQMAENPSTSTSQPYVRFGSSGGWGGGGSSSIAGGRTVNVKNNSSTVFSILAPKTINYALYSSPSMTSSSGWTITGDTSTPTCTGLSAAHSFGTYTQTAPPTCTTAGTRTALCAACGETSTQTIAPTGHSWSFVTVAPTLTQEGYDLYTCSLCGGQYRTNFTDPTGGADPCADGHTWDDGVVTTEPGCVEEGLRTYTCTVCGETSTAPISPLGHSFGEDGICTRCGDSAYAVTFVCGEGSWVTVYPTKNLTSGGVDNPTAVFARSGDTGVFDVTGDGQVNFIVHTEEGVTLEEIQVSPANYKNVKWPADATVEGSVRITKITGPITVTLVTSAQTQNPWEACDGEDLCPGKDFVDMPVYGSWSHRPIDWAITQGITNGTDATHFTPGGNCTRAQVVTFLWRAAGEPAPSSSETAFTDLREDSFYYEAVLWAVEQGITKGVDETHFLPNKVCTRADTVTFLYRWQGSPAVDSQADTGFEDVTPGRYYHDPIAWAVSQGITNGTDATHFSPKAICTRAHVVTFLFRTVTAA